MMSGQLAVLLLLTSPFAASKDCSVEVPISINSQVNQLRDCTTITSDLIVGDLSCTAPCYVTSFSGPTDSIRVVLGSLIFKCCASLDALSGWSRLTTINGSLIIDGNQKMMSLFGFEELREVRGSVIIRQNPILTETQLGGVEGTLSFTKLTRIGGYLSIDRNHDLNTISGLASLEVIEGNPLSLGRALVVTYNPSIRDLSWLRSLVNIDSGAVHIEGNSALCFAGYPRWGDGEYIIRSSDSAGDKGIDWRNMLSNAASWEYTWAEKHIPSLVIRDNGDSCGTASCHSSCAVAGGCLGPNDLALCRMCSMVGSVDTCEMSDPALPVVMETGQVWPPQGATLGLWIAIFVLAGTVVLLALALLICCFCKCCGRGNRMKSSKPAVQSQLSGAVSFSVPNQTNSPENVVLKRRSTFESDFLPAARQQNLRNSLIELEGVHIVNTYATTDPKSGSTQSNPVKGTRAIKPQRWSYTGPLMEQDSANESGPSRQKSVPRSINSISSIAESDWSSGDLAASAPAVDLSSSLLSDTSKTSDATLQLDQTLSKSVAGQEQNTTINFPSKQIKLKKELGSASFGKVYLAEAQRIIKGMKKSTIVVKVLKSSASGAERDLFLESVKSMKALKHRNILAVLAVCKDSTEIMLALEHCSNGNLKSFLVKVRWEQNVFKERGVIHGMACDIAEGLYHMHKGNIAHNDLACRNCLVMGDYTVKLGEYGLTKDMFQEDYYSPSGEEQGIPIRWIAPEYIDLSNDASLTHPPSLSGDIWSLGVTLWELCSFAQWPYEDLMNEEVVKLKQRGVSQSVLENTVDEEDLLFTMYSVMCDCWQRAEERPDCGSVLKALTDLKKEKVGKPKRISPSASSPAILTVHKSGRNETTTSLDASQSEYALEKPETAEPGLRRVAVYEDFHKHTELEEDPLYVNKDAWQSTSLSQGNQCKTASPT